MEPTIPMNPLFDKIYACNAVAPVANSMGDITETLSWREIEEKFGFLDRLLPQDEPHKVKKVDRGSDWIYHAHHRPAGMTEDGQERHRLICEAIIRKGGRIGVDDLAQAWLELIDPAKFGYLLGPQDQVIYWSLRAGIPPSEVGRYATYPGFHGTTKMIQPLGLINACNPAQAARDALDVGRIKDVSGRTGNYALEVAAGMAAGIAAAMMPGATVGGVIDTVMTQLSSLPRAEVQNGLDWARQHRDWKKLRELFDARYRGHPPSNAVEVLASALGLFHLCDGDIKTGMLWSVNFGRDTDDRAYDVAGLSAALNGSAGIPREWIDTIEEQLPTDPHTVSRRSLQDTADGLYRAALAVAEVSRTHATRVDALR
jgi:ADP-ribosylglycohydrolase